MIWKAILISLSLLWTPSVADHGIYITVIEIHHNQDDQTGQVIIKSFSDDLMNALKVMDSDIDLGSDPCADRNALAQYVDQHLSVSLNGKDINLEIAECSPESDTHWIYLDFELEGQLESSHIETDWMTELFGNQQNIIKLISGERRLNDRLSSDKTVSVLNF